MKEIQEILGRATLEIGSCFLNLVPDIVYLISKKMGLDFSELGRKEMISFLIPESSSILVGIRDFR